MKTIEQIFSAYNPRFREAKNEWNMKCPFRENHTRSGPGDGSKSFFVNTEKNYYNCFSCGVHGNLISLLVGKMQVGFMDAHEIVTVTNIDYLFKYYDRKQAEAEFDTIIPVKPPESFLKRGFSRKLLSEFKIGGEDDLICIPIPDNDGNRIVGIKYRQGRKFWYAPEGFQKGLYLYNYAACKGKKWFILEEGETDILQSAKNGTKNCCATLGSILTEEQAEVIIDGGHEEVLLAFDKDLPGMKNIEVANYRLSPYMKVKVMDYDAEDPGSCEEDEWHDAIDHKCIDYSVYTMQMSIEHGDDYLKIKNKALKNLRK